MEEVVNCGGSADGAISAVYAQVAKPCPSQYLDIEELTSLKDVNEEHTSLKETGGSDGAIKALEEEIQSLRHPMEEMKCSEIGAFSPPARVTKLEGDLARSEEDTAPIYSKAKGDFNSLDSLRLVAEALEADKAMLEASFRDVQALKAVEDALTKEEVIKSPNTVLDVLSRETIDVLSGEAISTEKKEHDKIFEMEEKLKKWKKMMKMERLKFCKLIRKKNHEIAHLNEELMFAMEKANVEGVEKERARAMTLQKESEINSLDEKLKNALRESMQEMDNANETTREMEANASLEEELRLAREDERERLEMKNKAIATLAEKEREVLSLKQEMLLVREKVMDEFKTGIMEVVANEEIENFLAKEHVNQMGVCVRMKNENLDGDVLARGTYLIDWRRPKISPVSAVAIAASTGTIAAVVAFFLRHKKQS